MSIKLQLPRMMDLRPRLTVMGIGGAGCNAINNMIASGLTGVDFIVANTDAQALSSSSAERRIQLGATLTEGLGAGSKPEVGEAAAEEAIDDLKAQIIGSHMLFIAAGMGGGTGTGAAAVVARTARELGILTVAIVTKPFQFEGVRRQRIAEIGIEELRQYVDTLIVIPNQNLFRVANDRTTFAEAFVLADQVLYSGVACIVDLIIKEGLINLDFADVRTVLAGMGTAMMGTGEASGERRAIEAAEEAIANPLLDDVSLKGARGLLLSISGGRDLTLYEVDAAASRVRAEVDPEANIIVGATFDESLGDRVRVSIVASGMLRQAGAAPVYGTTSPGQQLGHQSGHQQAAPAMFAMPSATPAPPHGQLSGLTAGSPVVSAPNPPSRNGSGVVQMAPGHQPMTAGYASAPINDPGTNPGYNIGREPVYEPEPDMQRRLSAAIQTPVVEEFAAAHRRETPPDPREPWRRGGVTIEETPPLGYGDDPISRGQKTGSKSGSGLGSASGGASLPASARPVHVEDQPFRPELTADVRRHPRRVPEIDEFPPLAQREFQGRNEPPRKPGLFERLAGLGRRADDSNHNESLGHGNGGNVRSSAPENARQSSNSGALRGQVSPSPSNGQASDMPSLLRKDRR